MRHLIPFLFLYGCATSQADESVVSANEIQKESFARINQVLESAEDINENTYAIIRQSCLTFCLDKEIICTCKCNVSLNKLRNITASYSLKYVLQWENHVDEYMLSQKERSDCESF